VSHRYSVLVGAMGAAIVAISLTPPLAGQAQTGAAVSQPPSRAQEEARKLIRDVAESLRAKEAANELTVPPKNWKPARTPWGDPDLSGVYTNSDESGIPFEKPAEFDGRRPEDITPAELATIQQARRDQTLELAVRLSDDPNPQLFWWETLNAKNSRVWLVTDPPDGKVPPTTEEGLQRASARADARRLGGRGPADSYEDRSLYDQCISRGLPGSMMPAIYGSSYQIHQGPGYVAIRYEMIHETRVIPLAGGPHVGTSIRSYMGDARGRWEGNTLVVETTNFKDQIAYRGADGGSLRVIERFTPIGPATVQWAVTFEDPHTWTRPWTFAMNLSKKDQSQQPYEYACHEGNYGLRNILSAARAVDKASEAKPASPASSATPRISPVPESSFTDAQKQIVTIYGQDGRATNDLLIYLNHPVLARNIMPFEHYITNESTLIPRHRELLILRTAWLCHSAYLWAHHAQAARNAGIGSDELTRIARGPDAPGWEGFEATLLHAADELHASAFVSDPTWSALTARYDTRQVMDAVFTVAEFTMVAGTLNSTGVQIEDRFKDRLPATVPSAVTIARNDERLIGKTARILPLEPSEWAPDVRQWLDRSGSGRPVAAIYRTYARHLAMDQPRTLVSEHIRQTSTLSPRTRELLIMRIGLLCRSEYEWAAHAPAGRRTGMTEADVQRIVTGSGTGGDPVEAALLQAVDELYGADVVSDRTWSALAATFDSRQMLDVLITIGGYRMVSMALNSFGVQLEPGAVRFPASLSR
jgi:alkylhydroperoxidase family enzyme